MLPAFVHLLLRIFARWYAFLGTSPGGIAAQIIVLLVTEVQGGLWRLEAWKKGWKSGLKRAGFALAVVWIPAFAACTVTTIYDDHQELVAVNEALGRANETLKEENTALKSPREDPEKQKRLKIRTDLGRLLDLNIKIRETCMDAKHPPGFSCMGEYLRWRDRTRKYISDNMEPQYLSRFKATTGTYMGYKSSTGNLLMGDDSDAMNLLNFCGVTLDEFIREFQN